MAHSAQTTRIVRIETFEVNLTTGELRKNGVPVKLAEQPFQVLAALLERPGKLVTREALRERLWPDGTYVDFDRALNTAVAKIRDAMGDSADEPRFIETLPRRGYRFIGPVEQLDSGGHVVGLPEGAGADRVIAHYRLLEKLGEGGMGVVYKALDTKLNRPVALKFLAPRLTQDPDAKRRFRREARAAAAVDHPNICTVHEINEVDGQIFIAMAYIEGPSLDKKITAGPLPLDEALDIAVQTAQGLQAAHEKGVVHRDIKSANILLTTRGQVKIVDFGLAQLADPERLTKTGTTLGTPAYMSPEQARWEELDRRTDIWSLGVVLYEMVRGQLPFQGEVERAMMHSILHADPEPLTSVRTGVPIELDYLIDKTLAKERDERYQHIDDVLVDLRELQKDQPSGADRRTTPWTLRPRAPQWEGRSVRAFGVVAAAIVLTIVGAALWNLPPVTEGGRPLSAWLTGILGPGLPEEIQLAILPFEAAEGQQIPQQLLDGLVGVVTAEMTRLEAARGSFVVAPAREVFKHDFADLATAKGELGANVIVQGTVRQQDDNYSLVLRLRDPADGKVFDSVNLSHSIADPTGLQRAVTTSLTEMLGVDPASQPRADDVISKPRAYTFYLQGRGYLQQHNEIENVEKALQLFHRSLAEDAEYALAYAGVGEAYWRKYEFRKEPLDAQQALQNASAAVRFGDGVPETHVALGLVHLGTGRHEEALADFHRALELDERNPVARRELARTYEALGNHQDAEATFRQAIAARPNLWTGYKRLGGFYNRRGRYQEALEQFRRVLELTPHSAQAHLNVGAILYYLEDVDGAREHFEQSIEIRPRPYALSNLGMLHLEQLNYDTAAELFERAVKLSPANYQLWNSLGDSYKRAGENVSARKVYRRAAALGEQALEVNPGDLDARAWLAHIYAMLDDRSRAEALQVQVDRESITDVAILVHSAWTHAYLGNRDRARQLAKKAMSLGYSMKRIRESPRLGPLFPDSAIVRELRPEGIVRPPSH